MRYQNTEDVPDIINIKKSEFSCKKIFWLIKNNNLLLIWDQN